MSLDSSSQTEIKSHSSLNLRVSSSIDMSRPKIEEKDSILSNIETKKFPLPKALPTVSEKEPTTLVEQQLARLLKEAQEYQAKIGYENQIKAAFYYNTALVFCEKQHAITHFQQQAKIILEQLAKVEFHYPQMALSIPIITLNDSKSDATIERKAFQVVPFTQAALLARLCKNPYQAELSNIRAKAKAQSDMYQKQQNKSPTFSEVKAGKGDAKALIQESKLTMQSIYRQITANMKMLVATMIVDCINENSYLLGLPLCDYAFIGFGSLAREEMTPYSDLEFGILISDDKHKEYFRNITKLFHLKIINLGETTATIMNMKLPILEGEENPIPSPVPKGLSFDGIGAGGCKNPLGRSGKFELIGTPQALADYQAEKHYEEFGPLENERFLPSSLVYVTLIVGSKASTGEQLLKDYLTAIDEYLRQPATSLWGNRLKDNSLSLRQARALELLVHDMDRFRPKIGEVGSDARNFSVKYDFYRLPNMLFTQLALYYGLDVCSLWDQVKVLETSTHRHPALFTSNAQKHLQEAIDRITFHRLNAYLHHQEQAEKARLVIDDEQIHEYASIEDKCYQIAISEVKKIYYCLIPLWQAARCFRDQRGNAKAFQAVFPDLYSESAFVRGHIKQLLEGCYQALPDFKLAVSEAKKTLELKNVDQQLFAYSQANLAYALQALGKAQYELHDFKLACESLSEAILIFRHIGSQEVAELVDCQLHLALALKQQGKRYAVEAEQHLQEATQLIHQHYGQLHPYSARCEVVKAELENTLRVQTMDWHIPPTNDDSFVGREKLLAELADRFKAMTAGQRVVLSAVSGLGGVGKTHLAIQYLHHPKQYYQLRVWFRAESAVALSSDYQEFAYENGLVPRGKPIEKEVLLGLVKNFFEKHTHWLAVYDNIENYNEIRTFLPTKGGHVILTTRRHEWPQVWPKELTTGWKGIEIGVFSSEEAIQYLKRFAGDNNVKAEAGMKALAKELAYLPLALAQAAAYIKKRGISITDYLGRYRQRKSELLADPLLPVDSESRPVATTWDISVELILDEEGMGVTPERSVTWNLLQAISYLHSEQIPYSLLECWIQEAGFASEHNEAKNQLKQALAYLKDYSLIQLAPEQQTLTLHRLVQDVMRGHFNFVPRKELLKEIKETKIGTNQPFLEMQTVMLQARAVRVSKQTDKLATAEQALRTAIGRYKSFGNSYALELSHCYLELALLKAAQNQPDEAKKIVEALVFAGEGKISNETRKYIEGAETLSVQYGRAHSAVRRCHHILHQLSTPLASGKRSFLSWHLPSIPTPFAGREQLLQHLAKQFQPGVAHEKTSRTVLLGLDGLGKTTLAAYYLNNPEYDYELRILFQASDYAILLEEYRSFAKEFNLLPKDTKEECLDSEVIYNVKRYLETYPDWLLVYDDAGSYKTIKKFLPSKGGHIVITTCRREWQDVANTLEVGSRDIEAKESVTQPIQLNKRSHNWNQHFSAIEQDEREAGNRVLSLPILYQIAEKSALAKTNSVSREALEHWLQEQKISIDAAEAKIDLDRASGCLQSYSIIEINTKEKMLNIHPLMRDVALTQLADKKYEIKGIEQKRETKIGSHLETVMSAITHQLNYDVNQIETVKSSEKFIPHALVAIEYGKESVAALKEVENLLEKIIAYYLDYRQSTADAYTKELCEKLLIIQKKLYNNDSIRVVETTNRIGEAFYYQSDYINAAKTFQEALNILNSMSVGDSKEVQQHLASTQSLYADVIAKQGKYKVAEELHRRAILIQEKLFPDKQHIDLADTYHALGNALYNQGKYDDAMQEFKKSFAVRKNYYEKHYNLKDDNHPKLARTIHMFGSIFLKKGQIEMAEEQLKKGLAIEERHHGDYPHADIAKSYRLLAEVAFMKKQYDSSKDRCEKALKIQQELYPGHDHPQIARTLFFLGKIFVELKNPDRAKKSFQDAYEIFLVKLNAEHQETCACKLQLDKVSPIDQRKVSGDYKLSDLLNQQREKNNLHAAIAHSQLDAGESSQAIKSTDPDTAGLGL